MVTKLTNQVIKYLVYGLIVYTLFSYVPQKQLPMTDIALMTTVIIISFIFLDILTPTYSQENFNPIIENLELDALEEEQENSEDINEEENIEDQESGISISYLNTNKPEILKKLQDNKVLDEEDVNEILEICKDKEECNNKFLDLLNDNKINNEELLELNIAFGLNKFNVVQELYLQERINREQALEIGYAINSNSYTLIMAIIQKYLETNVITKSDFDKLSFNIELEEDSNEGRSFIANMIRNDLLNTKNAKIINEKCSSSSMDSCTIQINKFKKDKVINNSQAVSILKGFNKPGINDIVYDNSDFGSISNEYVVGSVNEQTDLGDVNFENNLLKDEKLIKQSKSGNAKKFNNIDIDGENNEEDNTDLSDKFNKSFEKNKSSNKEYKQKINKKYKKFLNVNASNKYDMHSDMNYSIYSERQTEPLGKFSKDFTNNFDHGFSYLQTDKWKPPEYDNTVCKIEKKCDYCEEDYEGYPVDVSKWNYSRKILPRDNINVKYIEDKLNTGNI
jgi:hypothetical protein